MLACEPRLVGVRPAGEVVPGLTGDLILHAAPPTRFSEACELLQGGLVGAALLTRVMSTLLFGVSATDIVTFSAVPVILATIALLASYLPARRATQVDPVVALRDE